MPPLYQPGKFGEKMKRLRAKNLRENELLRNKIKSRSRIAPDPFCAQLGKDIAKARKSLGISQMKLAGLVDTTQSSIGRVETGRHNLTIKKIRKIARVLKKELSIVLK